MSFIGRSLAISLLSFRSLPTPAQEPQSPNASDVSIRTANILSEGVRMHAEVFSPKVSENKRLPTIIMSHGWGGTVEGLKSTAAAFAKAGFLVVAFDYRGWGNSDGRLILKGAKNKNADGKTTVETTEIREVVDPIDQTTDIMNAVHWSTGEIQCDAERIGLWGTSYSGGHVLYVAARDPRVKAFVSQVGALDSRWTVATPAARARTYRQALQRTRGEIGYPPAGTKFMNMTGQPVWEKLMQYAPIEDVGRCKECAKLFIVAENEELFDNGQNAILAHSKAEGAKKLVVIPGIKHYDIYSTARPRAEQEAIAWFDEHLRKRK